MRKLSWALLATSCALFAMPVLADIADGVNQIRRAGCEGRPGVKTSLRPDRDLDSVAKEWSKGGRLRDAFARTDYRSTDSASMKVEGSRDERAILGVLRSYYCEAITNAAFKQIGVYRRDDTVWIVVATPFNVPATKDAARVSQKVLALVNEARSQGRKCGRTVFQPAPPLRASPVLARAASIHNDDMSVHDFFEHEGSDGSQVGERVARVGYEWSAVGENIAIGAPTAETVVSGWLDSPGHCRNIMAPQFTEMGIAYLVNRKRDAGIYWTQVFAHPR